MYDTKAKTRNPERCIPQFRVDKSSQENHHRSPQEGGFTHNLQMKNKREYNVDNKWVVPYSPFLSLKYGAHINVEIVNSVKAIKYMYKYISKGHNKVTFTVEGEKDKNRQFKMKLKIFFTHGTYLQVRHTGESTNSHFIQGNRQ